jgi:CRP/FNR family transcriptional regulator, cyclic AMP receptor protein
METLDKILREHPFLKGLEEIHLDLITGCAANVVFKKNEFLFHAGDPANLFYFIRNGRVVIETYIPGKGPVKIQSRSEGDVTGWSWLIPPYRWHFDARAVETTRAIVLDGKCLREKMETDHDLGYALFKRFAVVIAERLEATRIQLLDIYGTSPTK